MLSWIKIYYEYYLFIIYIRAARWIRTIMNLLSTGPSEVTEEDLEKTIEELYKKENAEIDVVYRGVRYHFIINTRDSDVTLREILIFYDSYIKDKTIINL